MVTCLQIYIIEFYFYCLLHYLPTISLVHTRMPWTFQGLRCGGNGVKCKKHEKIYVV